MRLRPLPSALAVLAAAAAAAGCGAGEPPSRAGADVEPVTLTATGYEQAGRIGARTLAEFARRVAALSNGAVRITLGPAPDNSLPDTSATSIADVRSGRYDLAVAATRSFDRLGVLTMQALQAPFLVESNELGARILADEIADEMLGGLEEIGLQGLALTFDSRRFPLAYQRPIVAVGDYDGVTLAARPSEATYTLLRALGARPTSINGGKLAAAAANGLVSGSEGVIGANQPVDGSVTANAPWYLKANAIVANEKVFDGLSDAQQSVLRQAAAETREWAAGEHGAEAEAAKQMCATGHGAVALASARQLVELRAAAQPVLDAMTKDPVSKRAIARMRELAGEVGRPAIAPCVSAPKPQSAGVTSNREPSLDGVWRLKVTSSALEAAGAPPDWVGGNTGVWTFRLKGGRGTVDQPLGDPCIVSYAINGSHIDFDFAADPASGCGGVLHGTFEVTGETATFQWTKDDGPDPVAFDNAFFKGGLHRVGQAPRSKQSVLDGKWRANIQARSMLGHPGFTKEDAYRNAGVWTFTFANGSYSYVEPNGRRSCDGTFVIEGALITMTETSPAGECDGVWTASFVRSGDSLQFAAPPSDPTSWIGALLAAPLHRIGDAP